MTVPAEETIRIEAGSRWDALDLARRLAGLHTYLVQLGDSRWLVCVRVLDPEASLPRVREAAHAWAAERELEVVLRVETSGHVLPR